MKRLRYGLAAVAAVAIITPMTAPAGAAEPGGPGIAAVTELVKNGTFANGTTSWWNQTTTPWSVSGGVLNVNVAKVANSYDAIVGQDGIPLSSGKSYTISFDAKASAAVSMRSTVQLNAAPYTAPHDKTVALTTSMKHYTYTFTSNVTTATGQVDFQLGNNTAYTFTVDNVSLTTGTPDSATNFYVDPTNNAYTWAGLPENQNDSRRDSILGNLASKPGAKWFGDWNRDVQTDVDGFVDGAEAAGKTPILAAYNIYGRDCGSYSGGGPSEPDLYKPWIDAFAKGIGSRHAIVILEPDAVPQMLTCNMSETNKTTRKNLLTYATLSLKANAPNAYTYLDAGNAGWIDPVLLANDGLKPSGIANVRGFALNVSNYKTTAANGSYGAAINTALGTAKKFIIDTSRNGGTDANGDGLPDQTDGNWCNSRGAKLGVTSQTGTNGAEYLLWVKFPGDSDGKCDNFGHNDPPAGSFSADFAQALITGNWSGL